uniref:(northern house mosquito) hypothetical protein n=1 Tax=Culex pipiens TaxID=7175 RepID=A0A8D8HBN6_CULPI
MQRTWPAGLREIREVLVIRWKLIRAVFSSHRAIFVHRAHIAMKSCQIALILGNRGRSRSSKVIAVESQAHLGSVIPLALNNLFYFKKQALQRKISSYSTEKKKTSKA